MRRLRAARYALCTMLRTRIIAGPAAVLVVSAVFATLLTLVTRVETFIEPTRVVPGQPAPVTLRIPRTRLQDDAGVEERAPVIGRGVVVRRPSTAALVRSFEDGRRPPELGDLLGIWSVIAMLLLGFTTYLRSVSPGRGALVRIQLGLLGVALVFLATGKAVLLATPWPAELLPVATLPLWASLYLDRRSGVVTAVAMALLTASLVRFNLVSVGVFLASSVTAVLTVGDQRRPARMVLSGLYAGLAGAAAYLAGRVIFEADFDLFDEVMAPFSSPFLAAATGGVLGGGLAWLLRPLGVWALGTVSRQRLLELSDLDQPLLQKMASEAPGSWAHSRAMANLAEAAATAIGADALLVRVGAYYHDLGKTTQSKYFVENMMPGETTPHRDLAPDVSADAIMAHVVEGVNILRRGRIPEPVVEFSYTHHGTSIIEFFWHKTLKEGNPRDRDEAFFRYPGMRPRTKETAILMLVDSIEAASRTVDPPEREKFEEMVRRIIFVKLRQGQLDESGLTMAELRVVSDRIVDSLCSMFHSRIRYPWQDQKPGEALPIPGVATEADVALARESLQDREAEPPSGETALTEPAGPLPDLDDDERREPPDNTLPAPPPPEATTTIRRDEDPDANA